MWSRTPYELPYRELRAPTQEEQPGHGAHKTWHQARLAHHPNQGKGKPMPTVPENMRELVRDEREHQHLRARRRRGGLPGWSPREWNTTVADADAVLRGGVAAAGMRQLQDAAAGRPPAAQPPPAAPVIPTGGALVVRIIDRTHTDAQVANELVQLAEGIAPDSPHLGTLLATWHQVVRSARLGVGADRRPLPAAQQSPEQVAAYKLVKCVASRKGDLPGQSPRCFDRIRGLSYCPHRREYRDRDVVAAVAIAMLGRMQLLGRKRPAAFSRPGP